MNYDEWKSTEPDEPEDETTCDTCGQPCRRLLPLAAIDVCDDCHRIAEQNDELVQRHLRNWFNETPFGGGEERDR